MRYFANKQLPCTQANAYQHQRNTRKPWQNSSCYLPCW